MYIFENIQNNITEFKIKTNTHVRDSLGAHRIVGHKVNHRDRQHGDGQKEEHASPDLATLGRNGSHRERETRATGVATLFPVEVATDGEEHRTTQLVVDCGAYC